MIRLSKTLLSLTLSLVFLTCITAFENPSTNSNLIHLRRKTVNTQSEKSNVLEAFNKGEFRKRNLAWKESVQLLVHLTDTSYLPQLMQG